MILNVMKVCPQAKIFLSFRKKIIFFQSFIQICTQSGGYKG